MSNLNNNTTQLESLLAKVNALPDAGAGGIDTSGGNADSMICFIIAPASFDSMYLEDVNTYLAVEGMTWSEWIESDYNTLGVADADGYPSVEVEMMGTTMTQYIVVLDDQLTPVYSSEQVVNNKKYRIG